MVNPYTDIVKKLNQCAIFPKVSKIMRSDKIECDGVYITDVNPLLSDEAVEYLYGLLGRANVVITFFPNLGEIYIKLK